MVKRRSVLAGVSCCLAGGGYVALTRSGSNEGTMETGGQGNGCRSGVEQRPANGTFEFVNILQFEEVELHIEVKSENVERIEISSDGETVHAVSSVTEGRQKITFAVDDATTFDITVLDGDGSVIDSARFYSRCSSQTTGSSGATTS